MKSFFRFSFATIILTLFSGVFTVTETRASNPLPEILNRMEVNRNAMKTLRSKVTMVKYNAQLKESDTNQGTSIFMPTKGRDALVRIDWTKPVEETLAVVNGKYVFYRPRLKQAIVGNAKDAKGNGKANGALSFMNMSKDQLKANYTIKYLGQEKVSGDVPTWRLELTPKKATSFKMAELWVDGNGMPIQAKVVESNNDTTTVLLSDFEKNAKINLSQFEVKLPKDTKIVKG
ncbi:MAG: outer membrane lipoprotein carrier protein LolA [Acidobacteriota bacterium]|jgi:outer membrane lipoprotein-sorting protein|nr:outer membrane lipoprotein carrier protein LolA [Acidobacteriota bacterium]MDQ3373010.1 outer membrane lipoprotein carrier protein LolA [Acidobacteriota bacterium]